MAKIMLVEDDNNLREIYEARLLAEGHEIISAHDGEEALALAVKEKPELIISDVMMPKISGFDMLDILRSSPETKHTKVIMMTALSQLEDKERADRLGADRYLVKSQVTLEDVIRVAREVLEGPGATETNNSATEPIAPIGGITTDMPPTAPNPEPEQTPLQPAADMPVAQPPADDASQAPVEPAAPAADPSAQPLVDTPEPAAAEPVVEPAPTEPVLETPAEPVAPETPVETPAPEAPVETPTEPQIENAQTSSDELSTVESQINDFVANSSGEPAAPVAPVITEAPVEPSTSDGFVTEPTPVEVPAEPVVDTPVDVPETPVEAPVETQSEPAAPETESPVLDAPSANKRTIQPLGDPTATPDLEALAAKEAEKEAAQQIMTDAANAASPAPQPAPEAPAEPTSSDNKPNDPNAIAL